MSEEFGPNFITLTDEDGNDIELEYVDALEDNGQTYMAFFPTVDDETDEKRLLGSIFLSRSIRSTRRGVGGGSRRGFRPGDPEVRDGKRRGAADHPGQRRGAAAGV